MNNRKETQEETEKRIAEAEKRLSPQAKRIFCIDFENYKSNVCHLLRYKGDIGFLIAILEDDTIGSLARNGLTGYALYLLAMVDYVSRENGIPRCTDYDGLRTLRLPKLLIPVGIKTLMRAMKTDQIPEDIYVDAIPEFLEYNILEGDVRNVY